MSGSLAGKSRLNNLILILSFRHDFKRKVRGTEEAAPVTMSQKCPYVDSYVTPPHCDGRAGECGLWSQTAKPKSEIFQLPRLSQPQPPSCRNKSSIFSWDDFEDPVKGLSRELGTG